VTHVDTTRRSLLVGAVALLAGGLTGCQSLLRAWLTRHDNSGFERKTFSFEDTDRCLLTAEAMEGPYFIDRTALRRDIREEKPGVPLDLRLRVVAGDGCTPVPGALVEVWQCDALGAYSGFTDASPDAMPMSIDQQPPRDDTRFLRGGQIADPSGLVSFRTIVPGFYAPRVQHIHVKVFVEEGTVLTSQVYFPEQVIAAVEAQEPYRQRGPSPFTNRNDIAIHESEGATGGWLRMSGDTSGYVGSVTLGIPA
jgi:protocatechuate 3,4-dioxygenase beta subunit